MGRGKPQTMGLFYENKLFVDTAVRIDTGASSQGIDATRAWTMGVDRTSGVCHEGAGLLSVVHHFQHHRGKLISMERGDESVFANECLAADVEVITKPQDIVGAEGEIEITAAAIEAGDRRITLKRDLTLFGESGKAVQERGFWIRFNHGAGLYRTCASDVI